MDETSRVRDGHQAEVAAEEKSAETATGDTGTSAEDWEAVCLAGAGVTSGGKRNAFVHCSVKLATYSSVDNVLAIEVGLRSLSLRTGKPSQSFRRS